jgi:hypothetical protein
LHVHRNDPGDFVIVVFVVFLNRPAVLEARSNFHGEAVPVLFGGDSNAGDRVEPAAPVCHRPSTATRRPTASREQAPKGRQDSYQFQHYSGEHQLLRHKQYRTEHHQDDAKQHDQ